jgi:hypothetical protein
MRALFFCLIAKFSDVKGMRKESHPKAYQDFVM